MARTSPSASVGLQFVVDQVGEVLGAEQVVIRIEQDIASRTNLADVKSHLERFVAEDQQHAENYLQVLRMMLGSEATVQASIDRGRQLSETIIAASQESAFSFVRGLTLLVYQTALAGRIFMQIQPKIDNREIIGLLETNHHQDETHLRYLETQLNRAAEELSGLIPAR